MANMDLSSDGKLQISVEKHIEWLNSQNINLSDEQKIKIAVQMALAAAVQDAAYWLGQINISQTQDK